MSPKSPDFDWVSARNTCTANRVFNKLRELVRRDVETRNGQTERQHLSYSASPPGTDPPWIAVRRDCNGTTCSVQFRLVEGVIRVCSEKLDPPVGFDVQVRMNDDGECVCFIGDKQRLPWQILHRALDDLLFGHFRI